MKYYDKFYNGVNRRGTDCYKWDLQKTAYNTDKILPFWVADSDYETLEDVKEAFIKRCENSAFGYTLYTDELYESIIKWCFDHYGYKTHKDNIVITTGVVNGLYFIVNLFTNEGDSILVNPPVYNPFYNVIKDNNRTLVMSKLIREEIDDLMFTYHFDFDDLEEKIKKCKMFILCNPHNPVGRCYKYEEIERIVQMCKKYNCILVSDEIHCDLIMEGSTFTSVGTFFNEYEDIILCTAPSKTFNVAGLSESNIIFNNNVMANIFRKKYEDMSIEINVFGLLGCLISYQKGSEWVKEQNYYLNENKNIVYDFVRKNKFKVAKLEATFLMWIDITRLGLTQDEIFNKLIEYGVWINNGTMYSSDCEGYIRLNIACGRKQLLDGLDIIQKFFNEFDDK